MYHTRYLLTFLVILIVSPNFAQSNSWQQAAGPNNNWQIEAENVPTDFSVAENKNILWKTTLPEGGQSSVILAGGKAFLTTNEPWPEGNSDKPQGSNVVGYCLDAETGKILWSVKIPGVRPMKYAGIFSDSTSPSPISDGEHVWFFNASGNMGCWDMDGKQIWIRPFQPRMRHHARKCQPILFKDVILFVEVVNKEAAKRTAMHKPFPADVDPKELWTHIHAIEKTTGKVLWKVEDATVIHNTPSIGKLKDGTYAILHARGGGHGPPEKPYGISLSSLKEGELGKTLWNSEEANMAYMNSHFNESVVAWFDKKDLVVFDVNTGKVKSRFPIYGEATTRVFDPETNAYKDGGESAIKAVAKGKIPHTNQTNILVGEYVYFMSYAGNSIGRISYKTGKSEFLQVPVQAVRAPGKKEELKYSGFIKNDTLNSRGIDIGAIDKRSKGSGWGHVSAPSPVRLGKYLFIPTMLGTVYVIDTSAPLTEKALVSVSDLGPAGQTWSLNSISFSEGKIYTRTMKEVICIGSK